MTQLLTRRRLMSSMATAAAAGALPAFAQATPVKMLVGFPAGGSADATARLIAEKMSASMGAPVIVENRPGAGGRIAAQAVKDAAPDGNTLMLVPMAVMVVQPVIFKSIKYDTTKDFTPVGNAATFPLALATGPATPAKNMTELIAWIKANPNQANYGSPATGSLPHFLGEMLGQAAGVKMQHVPFQGGAPLMTALLGGQLPMGFDTPLEFAENHRAGKLRIQAVSSAQRMPQFPDVPTLREAGINIEASAWFGIFGPAGMQAARVEQLSGQIQAALKQTDVASKLTNLGLTAAPESSQQMAQRMAADKARWEPVIKATGFQAD
ncbi:Bug family tripartite tricarboxylate transporter substrate binding protein [Variovorax sp. PCZ-1]|uniref:Bug family tripartite tricarboxylate transporter substrate binding protein n=1 Tax=Variovorax sp. PCZ-1 TaxID=2835533 RepID=UPI001BD07193|nr:Bug family tripartite tricarboxylate transporter substrate binding protein [Variovorax sp. PCZ-1]MBS7808011.1 Bug family tripartite tricarboxylate transporter substrate binding protein [Variovorax sp. PCZ-1]